MNGSPVPEPDRQRDGTQHNRNVYETYYSHDHLRIDRLTSRYERAMIALRLDLIKEHGTGRIVVDLGCGSGAYLLPASAMARTAYGVDFSQKLLATCAERLRGAGVQNAHLVLADLQSIPLADSSVDFVFSIATLYYVPMVQQAVREAARILRPGGSMLLEFGNTWSLNTLVVKSAPSGVRSYHISVGEMQHILRQNGLGIESHRTFQLLPMYGGPLHLRPLVSARWKALMGQSLAGRLVDEFVSSLPLLRRLAFRHLFVCRRAN